ncbi:MAG: UDP-N-acetylmuramoyl-L-alanyl-D-glutamate--2,6-diaminopimelate ligase [Actinomycetota bacterium]|nr:UDP-N-acetylmuramoyl-L-alanyl-D-glutamate--2,6-diaminopimelate ligase [Actinomycetota bacterium]
MTAVPRPTPRTTTLAALFPPAGGCTIIGDAAVAITGLELDSREVRQGDLFAALSGHHTHGAGYITAARSAGAAGVLTDVETANALTAAGLVDFPIVVATNPRQLLGTLAALIYQSAPDISASAALRLFGVTGTNGKTTVTYLVEAGLRTAGHETGLVGTVGVHIGDESLSAIRTTPEAPHLHALLGVMRERGIQDVVLEVSSHALIEGRVNGLEFSVTAFTNLSQDHLDYHGTMEAYFMAKAELFTPQRSALGIIGVDTVWGLRLAAEATIPVVTWSSRGAVADWRLTSAGGRTLVSGPGGEKQELQSRLPGAFNQSNILCAYVMLRSAGVTPEHAATGIASVVVPGRMEVVCTRAGVTAIVDYAHTPEAVTVAINGVRENCTGALIVVLGAGGDRDRNKRAEMGKSAALLADHVIVTDDNPRSEDPALIRAAIIKGARAVTASSRGELAAVTEVSDRRAAIVQAVSLARRGDFVLVLGKGHELGQEITGEILPFDDRDELREAFNSEIRGDQ